MQQKSPDVTQEILNATMDVNMSDFINPTMTVMGVRENPSTQPSFVNAKQDLETISEISKEHMTYIGVV